jgi:hypothetical protein
MGSLPGVRCYGRARARSLQPGSDTHKHSGRTARHERNRDPGAAGHTGRDDGVNPSRDGWRNKCPDDGRYFRADHGRDV